MADPATIQTDVAERQATGTKGLPLTAAAVETPSPPSIASSDRLGEKNDRTIELIKHLSSEAIKEHETTIAFRNKISFSGWVAPFLLLSSLIVATKGRFTFLTSDLTMWGCLLTVAVCYLVICYLSARIEKVSWNRCNRLRGCIMLLAQTGELPAEDKSGGPSVAAVQEQHKHLVYIYLVAWLCIFAAILAWAVLVTRVVKDKDIVPEPSGVRITADTVNLTPLTTNTLPTPLFMQVSNTVITIRADSTSRSARPP